MIEHSARMSLLNSAPAPQLRRDPRRHLYSFDSNLLRSWLDDNVPQPGEGPLELQLITGGSTNLIVRLDRGEGRLVFAAPPLVATPAGCQDHRAGGHRARVQWPQRRFPIRRSTMCWRRTLRARDVTSRSSLLLSGRVRGVHWHAIERRYRALRVRLSRQYPGADVIAAPHG